jgi:hypothetical protein
MLEMDPAITLTLRFCLALLFAAAATHKIRDALAFRDTLSRYELVPAALVGLVGAALMGADLLVAVAVVFATWASGLAAAILALYTVAIAINVWRGRTDLSCGCMGPAASAPLSAWLVARNLVLVAVALAAAAPQSARPLVWFDVITVIGATGALVACWLASERLLALAPSLKRLKRTQAERRGSIPTSGGSSPASRGSMLTASVNPARSTASPKPAGTTAGAPGLQEGTR